MSQYALYFLGTGNAAAMELGSASCVLERDGAPCLQIDCGPDSLRRYKAAYGDTLPPAIFVTHTHMDHVGGLEGLFFKAWFDHREEVPIRLYVPVDIIPLLHDRIGRHPSVLAEGGANFWDCFQLVPVDSCFWHQGLIFKVFPVRHHEHRFAYGLSLPGHFLYTGDTRPIPEILNRHASHGETVFHDCALQGNPSHTGLDDLAREYTPAQLERFVLYHYESGKAGDTLAGQGYRIARAGDRFVLQTAPSNAAASTSLKLAR